MSRPASPPAVDDGSVLPPESSSTGAAPGTTTPPVRRRTRTLLERWGLLPSPPEGHLFHAFISYSHAADGRLAPALQKGLQRFAKPWYKARALRIFRDDASLSANPDLWESIAEALDESQHYILLASPRAAGSEWVAKEAAQWRATKSSADLLVALTDGEIVWDAHTGDFDWERTTALPTELRGAFTDEPRFIDLRWAHDAADLSLSDPKFRAAIADLAAPLHGRSKDELASEEVFQQRRTVRIARAVAGGLLVLTVAALVAAVLALVARSQAVHEQQLATSRALAAESVLALNSDPQLGLLLAVRAAKVAQTPQALAALQAALPENHLLRTLRSSQQPLNAAAWSPDGSLVVTGNFDGGAKIWNPDTGTLVRSLPAASHTPTSVEFDPANSGVLTWGSDQPARLWPLHAGSAPVAFTQVPNPSAATVSPDGQLVAASGINGTYVWDSRTGAVIRALPTGVATIFDVEIDPSDSLVATASDRAATIWSVRTGAAVRNIPAGGAARLIVNEARFSPDGTRLVTSEEGAYSVGGKGATSRIWSVATGKPVSPILDGWQARWSQVGGFLAITSGDGVVDLRTARNGGLYQQLKGQVPITGPALFSPDTSTHELRYVVTGSAAGSATVWNAVTAVPIATLSGQPGAVTAAGFSPDAGRVLTYGSDGTARIWDSGVVQPQPGGAANLRTAFARARPEPQQLFLDADPTVPLVARSGVGSQGRAALITNARTGAVVADLPGFQNAYFAFDRAGRVMLVTAGTSLPPGPPIAELRAAHGGQLMRTLSGPGSQAVGGTVSTDGRLAAAVDTFGRVGVWEVSTGRELHGFAGFSAGRGAGPSFTLKFSPDGTLVLAADPLGKTVVWNPRTGRVLNRIATPTAGVASGAISPDDRYVVSVSNGSNDAHLYRVGQPAPLLALTGSAAGIYDAAFNHDGTLLATTSPQSDVYDGDNTVRIWSTTNPNLLLTFSEGAGTRIEFSPDGHSLITNAEPPYDTISCVICGGFDYLLGQARERETRGLTAAEKVEYLGG